MVFFLFSSIPMVSPNDTRKARSTEGFRKTVLPVTTATLWTILMPPGAHPIGHCFSCRWAIILTCGAMASLKNNQSQIVQPISDCHHIIVHDLQLVHSQDAMSNQTTAVRLPSSWLHFTKACSSIRSFRVVSSA